MRDGLSHRVVGFIGNLFPLYESASIGGQTVARSLVDGTLIFPIDAVDDNEGESELVRVHWQGDPHRTSETLGTAIASIAVARYIELHGVATAKHLKSEYEHLARHFEHKTGTSLTLETGDDRAEAYRLLGQLLEKIGTSAAVALLKKAVGL